SMRCSAAGSRAASAKKPAAKSSSGGANGARNGGGLKAIAVMATSTEAIASPSNQSICSENGDVYAARNLPVEQVILLNQQYFLDLNSHRVILLGYGLVPICRSGRQVDASNIPSVFLGIWRYLCRAVILEYLYQS
ncbi:MAG: hypothetical protein WB677_12225, partial [Xanthobacteraceae bacterium]